MKKVIGIDLGTTTSCVAVCEGGHATVIKTGSGFGSSKVMPSIVAYLRNELRIGEMAKRQAVLNPTQTISSIKRFMGMTFEETKEEAERVPYQVSATPDGEAIVLIGERQITPQQVSAEILKQLKKVAEDYLNSEVSEAVITVPAYFNQKQKQATKDAAFIAGLEVRDILNEPTAAALAYGLSDCNSGKIVVFDLGGGTFDISVLDCAKGIYEVLSTCGNTHLGGDDLDHLLMDEIIRRFRLRHGTDLLSDPKALQLLKEATERAKIDLDTYSTTSITIPSIAMKDGTPLHLDESIDREEFEDLCKPTLYQCIPLCERALDKAGLTPQDIDHILLVGASTNMPLVRKIVRQFFHKDPVQVEDPEEMVAKGAAIQGAIICGDIHGNVLMDVTPLALGVMARKPQSNDLCPCWLIMDNTTLPTCCEEDFSTVQDYQKAVDIQIVQGFGQDDLSPVHIGTLRLENISQSEKGKPVIHVIFNIDVKGDIVVKARDNGTGEERQMPVKFRGKLTESQLHEMKQQSDDMDKEYAEAEWFRFSQKSLERILPIRQAIEEQNDSIDKRSIDMLRSLLLQYDEYCKSKNAEVLSLLESRLISSWNEIHTQSPIYV